MGAAGWHVVCLHNYTGNLLSVTREYKVCHRHIEQWVASTKVQRQAVCQAGGGA